MVLVLTFPTVALLL